MANQDRAWLLAAVGGMLVGLSACAGSASNGEVPSTVPADPAAAPAGSEKNHCKTGEPHHCASDGDKHVCGADHGAAPAPSDPPSAGSAVGSPTPVALDAGVVDGGGVDSGAADAAGPKPVPHTHTHKGGAPHKH
jgi:hypothetical protein